MRRSEPVIHITEHRINHSREMSTGNYNNISQEEILNLNLKKGDLFFTKCENEIKLLISIYYYNENLFMKLLESKKDKNDKDSKSNNIKTKCYLIEKEYIDILKKIFTYEKLVNCIKNKNITLYEINKEEKNVVKTIYNELIQDDTFLNNIEKKDKIIFIYKSSPLLTKLSLPHDNNNNDIYYLDNFYLINENTYKLLLNVSYYNNNNKNNINIENKKFIINNGKIILEYEYQSSVNNSKIYNILIGSLNKELLFFPEIILNFNDNENNRNSMFDILCNIKNKKYNLDTKETDIEMNGNVVGSIYKINNDKAPNLFKDDKIMKKRNKYLELLIYIFLNKLYIKDNIYKPINIDTKNEKYYIIKKKWMKIFLNFYEYKKFLGFINLNNIKNISYENLYKEIVSKFQINNTNDFIIKEKLDNFKYL